MGEAYTQHRECGARGQREASMTGSQNLARRPNGYTITELMIVLLICGVMAAMVVRTLSSTYSANARRSARREATSYIVRAQAIAVQQSRPSWLVRNGNVLKILVDSLGVKVQLGALLDVSKAFGATLAAYPKDTIAFDPRGFAILNGTTAKLIVSIATSADADTVCVTGMSRILTRRCP
jgi:prepilin-type N-terminal cleavage/methylation domain-containing protein